MKKIISLLLTLLMIVSVTVALPAVAAEAKKVDKIGWSITASSEIHWGTAASMIDGDTSTFWHTNYTVSGSDVASQDTPPYTIEIVLPKAVKATGLLYTPRQSGAQGRWEEAEIYVSANESKGSKVADFKAKAADSAAQTISFGKELSVKKITIVITKTSNNLGACAELDLLSGAVTATSSTANDTGKTTTASSGKVDKIGWSITASSEIHWGTAASMIDGDTSTFWHTNYTVSGSDVASQDTPPYTIEIVLPKAVKATGLLYTPRQSGAQGRWEEAEIYVSANESKGSKVADFKAKAADSAAQTIPFGKELSVKKVTIVITKASNNLGACAELDLLTGTVSGSGSDEATEDAKKDDGSTDKSGWTITSSSEIHWGTARNMLDGDKKTNWHTNYTVSGSEIASQDEPPYTIELTLPKALNVAGLKYTPRQDGDQGRWVKAEIYASSDGKSKGTKVADLNADPGLADDVTISFGKEVAVKKLTIVITESNRNLGACAELDLIIGAVAEDTGEDSDDSFNTKNWKITASSQMSPWGVIRNAFDGDTSTMWHSRYTNEGSTITSQDTAPYTIDITLPEKKNISGFTLIGRDKDTAGRVKAYELYAADTDDGELVLVDSGSTRGIMDVIDYGIAFSAKKLRFIVTDSFQNYGVIKELTFTKATDEKVYSVAEFPEAYKNARLYPIDATEFSVTCSEEKYWSTAAPKHAADGLESVWQTEELDGITSVTLTIDLGREREISAISILPRQSTDYHGYIKQFNMWSSKDGKNFDEVLTEYNIMETNLSEKMIKLDAPVTARYMEFEFTKYLAWRVSCGEITFWETKAQHDKLTGAGKFVMQIGSNEIKVEKGEDSFTKTLDTAPFITSAGRTLIPLRGLLEEMGAEIEWVDEDQSINISHSGKKLVLQIRNPIVWANWSSYGNVMYTLESAPRIKDSRTFVPLRFLSEQFGYTVTWDGATQTITIEK